jgi:glutamate-1-semialdehyde 2,1-aminomutase
MPGKNSNVRRGAQENPLFMERAEGARYVDVEGRDYIDFVAGMGPAIWGHSNSEYLEAIKEQVDRLFSIGSTVAQTTQEVELAEKIVQHVPGAEWVRFGISGSEADQLALRLARAYTGRPYVLRFENHYHGWMDNVYGGRAPEAQDGRPHPMPAETDTAGLGPEARHGSLMTRWNDPEALEQVLRAHADQVALVLMEPVMLNFGCCPPKPGYLERVRQLCHQHDVLLCFDEVFTGFRMGLGCAQGEFGVTPDLTVLAKAIAGGMPMSAVAGKREIMQVLREDRALVGGTFNSFPLAVAAALKSIELLERDNGAFYHRIDDKQTALVEGIRACAAKHGHRVLLQGPRGVFHLNFADLPVAYTPTELSTASDSQKLARFSKLLLEERVLVGGGSRWVVTDALTEQDIEETLARVDRAMQRV